MSEQIDNRNVISFSVRGGYFSTTIGARDALAIHTGARGSGNVAVTVIFEETATTTYGENIFIVGSIVEVGNWLPASSVHLSAARYPTWSVTLYLQPGTTFQYKFIRKETDGSVVWESDPNRQVKVASTMQTVTTSWR
ncbi:hypothetical protein AX14_002705 [Amanita brunnescens Koide BX004]|nr:hypothetical protein AX14_002705 [Amanita brunnescens Koide BX004]